MGVNASGSVYVMIEASAAWLVALKTYILSVAAKIIPFSSRRSREVLHKF